MTGAYATSKNEVVKRVTFSVKDYLVNRARLRAASEGGGSLTRDDMNRRCVIILNASADSSVLPSVRAISLLTLSLSICLGQPSSMISLSNGIQVRIVAKTDKAPPDPLKVEMKAATGNSVYRIFHDETGLAVYAYELVVDRLDDGVHFQVVAKPAGDEFMAKFPNADGGKPTPTLPRPFESVPLNPGGQFTIEIPTNPGWFEHRTDIVQVQPGASGRTGGTISPASARIRFAALRVAINGQIVPTPSAGAVVEGRYAMFYIPQRGGYFFSTQPVDSRPFVQGADVDGTTMKFTVDNENYECHAASPILMQSERGQIWIYHDPDYKPSGNLTKTSAQSPQQFYTAASDTISWWVQ